MRTLNLREQGCEESWLFFEAKRGRQAESLESTANLDSNCVERKNDHE
jgi:hypothetical protein